MANQARLGKAWDIQKQHWYIMLLENLRSNLGWRDLIVGFLAAVVISSLLVGFRHQVIPEFEVGQIANQDVRASKDARYLDREATALKRAEAEASVPLVYQLDQDLISTQKNTIRIAFTDGRNFLSEKRISSRKQLISASAEKDLVRELKVRVGDVIAPDVLPILLRDRFDPAVENRILKILDTVLREGIVGDRARFLKEQELGIVIRDSSFPFEHPLTDANLVRDLAAAGEYLSQFDLEFEGWSKRDREKMTRYLATLLVPTLVYNSEETESRREQAASRVPIVEVQIKRGQTIVRYGDRITPELLFELNALRNLWKPSSILWQGFGYFLYVALLLYFLWRYFVFFEAKYPKIRNLTTLILVIITSELVVVRLVTALANILDERFHRFSDPSVMYYAIPFALGPLLATLLVDMNLGILSALVLATLTGLFYGDMGEPVYLIVGSFAGIFGIRQYRDRAAILRAGLTVGVLNGVCLAGLNILRQNPIRLSDGIDLLAMAFLSGILAATLASMMLPALEYFFKIVTDIRLLELSNLNAPILRRLSVEAPGTYHHSLMVATLAEDAAEAVGANPLLARVSAYYHDIGKILKPEYFVENQSRDLNKHKELSPRISCLILTSHVKDGLQLAKEIGLPQRIREMIPQHHGTRTMSYFFQKAKEAADQKNGTVSDVDFRYAGPKPQNKEAAIMMMADSVEAASRTLSDPNPSQIRGMIDRLVDGIIAEDQFDECDITLCDIRHVKESFFKILAGIFHRRIDYPDYDFKSGGSKIESAAIQNPDSKQAETV